MVELQNINKTYATKRNSVLALKNISLKFNSLGLYIITGKSGSGKSTLLYSIAKYIQIDSGKIIFNGSDVSSSGENNIQIGFVFQSHNLLFDLDVFDNIIFGLNTNRSVIEKANKIINELDIEYIKYKFINELSGGEIQRVAIARSLVRDATIILADEPTANLDDINTKKVMNLLKNISKEKLVIMITHDENIVEEFADYHIKMDKGEAQIKTLLETPNELAKIENSLTPVNLKLERFIQKKMIKKNLLNRISSIFILSVVISLLIGILLTTITLHNYHEYDEVYRLSQLENSYNGSYDIIQNTAYEDDTLKINYNDVTKGYILEEKISVLNISYQRVYSTILNQISVNYMVGNNFDNFDLIGNVPLYEKEVLLSDFLYDYIFQSNQFLAGQTITLFNEEYSVVGIIETESNSSISDVTYYESEYLKNIYGVSFPRSEMFSYQSISPFRVGSTVNYIEGSVNVLQGRNIENSNEIIVSESYLNQNNLSLNYEYDVIDIYHEKYNGYFGDKINPHIIFGDKVIIVGTHNLDYNTVIVDQIVFESIKDFYDRYLSYNKIRIINMQEVNNFKKIYENNIQINHPTINYGKMFIYFKNNLSFLFIPFEVLLTFIVILLIYNLTKSLLFKKTVEIAIMRSLSTRKRDIFGLYYIQNLAIFVIIILFCSTVYIGAIAFLNKFNQIKELGYFEFVKFRYDVFSFTMLMILLLFSVYNLLILIPIFNKSIMNTIKDNK